jgi:hypothetical protein
MFLFLIHNSIAFPFSGFLGDGHFRAACFSHCRDMRAPCWPKCGNSIGTHGGIEIAWDTAHPIASAPPICRNSVGLSIPIGGRRMPRLFNHTRGFPGEGPVTFDIFTINVSSCKSNFHSIAGYVSPFGEVAQSTILCAQETRIHPLKAKRLSRDLEKQGWDTTIGVQPPVKKMLRLAVAPCGDNPMVVLRLFQPRNAQSLRSKYPVTSTLISMFKPCLFPRVNLECIWSIVISLVEIRVRCADLEMP